LTDDDKVEAVPILESQLGSVNDSDYDSVFTPREPGYGVGWCYKIVILFCISFLGNNSACRSLLFDLTLFFLHAAFGSYFIYDSVSALENDLTSVRKQIHLINC